MKRVVRTMVFFTVMIVFIGLVWIQKNTVKMDFAEKGEFIFKYKESNINTVLSEEELMIMCDIFEGRIMYNDNPSCGFSEDIAFKVNSSQTFCFARDLCPIVYWKEKGKYFRVSENEKEQLHRMLERHGLIFPCI